MALAQSSSGVKMAGKKLGKTSGKKKKGSGKKGKKSAKSKSAKSAKSAKVEPREVDILSPAAMENLYYIAHGTTDALDLRGFGWAEGTKAKGGKKGKGKGKGKKKK